MKSIELIRNGLGMSQSAFGAAIGVTQGYVSHLETAKNTITPALARKVIALAAEHGQVVTFDYIYSDVTDPALEQADETGAECRA